MTTPWGFGLCIRKIRFRYKNSPCDPKSQAIDQLKRPDVFDGEQRDRHGMPSETGVCGDKGGIRA